jgi:hypothetical protein
LQDIEQQQQRQQNGRKKLKKPLSISLERPGAVQLEALHCVVACAGAATNNSMAACVVWAVLQACNTVY